MREDGTGGLRVAGVRTGALSLGFLAVTVASGIALVPMYRPEAALESVEAIASGIPWAWVARGVHAFAALGFLLATGVHLAEVVVRGGTRGAGPTVPGGGQGGPGAWWRSAMLLPLAVAGMLTGFLMRGDAEATAALQVARGVMATIPGIGEGLGTLLLGPEASGLGTVALHHAGTFTVLPWLLAIEHGRRAWPDARSWATALLAAVAVTGVVPLPLGPAQADGAVLRGPWYLLGLQGMLLDLPVATAWVVPLSAFLAIGSLGHVRGRARTGLLAGLGVVAAAWAGWTVRLWVAGAP